MKNEIEQAIRFSFRLKDYDYSQNGAYFITICVQDKKYLFGEIVNHKMQLNKAGKMIDHQWHCLAKRYKQIELDEYIVMPNHLHGILIVGAARGKNTINEIIGAFKSISTGQYIKGVKNSNFRCFDRRLWQRNYYEHVIRNYKSLGLIREYIANNPLAWHLDRMNLALKFKHGDYF